MSNMLNIIRSWIFSEQRTPLIFVLKLFAFVVTFSACTLILAFIDFELSYDNWNPNISKIVRSVETRNVQTQSKSVSLPYPFADAAKTSMSGTIAVARVQPLRVMLRRDNVRYNELVYFSEPEFLRIFPLVIVAGDPDALKRPNSVILSESAANRYFGSQNPIGEVLSIGANRNVAIAAVMQDWPPNSHIRPDIMVSLETFFMIAKENGNVDRVNITGWNNCHCYVTYILFDSERSLELNQRRTREVLVSHQGENYADLFPVELQKLSDVYLDSVGYTSYLNHAAQGDRLQLAVFTVVIVLLLLISGLSFANFTTAQATLRAHNFAVHRILGAKPGNIILRITIEAILTTFVASIIGLLVALVLIEPFARFVNQPLTINHLINFPILAKVFGISAGVGILSGLAPAFILARINPLILMKGSLGSGGNLISGKMLRQILLGLQFTVSCILIIFALAVRSELIFVREQPLGFDPQNLLVLNGEGSHDILNNLLRRIDELPDVELVTIANSAPTIPLRTQVQVARQSQSHEEAQTVFLNAVEFSFMETLGIDIVTGRDFDSEFGTDHLNLASYFGPNVANAPPVINGIINLTALKRLGFSSGESAIGEVLKFPPGGGGELPFSVRIVGIADDVRYSGPRSPTDPLIYLARTDWNLNLHSQRTILIKAKPNYDPTLTSRITEIWNEFVPGFVADISPMENRVNVQIISEQRQLQLVSLLTIATIVLSILGILGFAAYCMQRESRSLAIRRVLGAKREEIAWLISSVQLKIVIVSVVFGCPIAWWLIARWLENFAVRTPLSTFWFLFGAASLIIVSFISLFAFTFRLSSQSPIKYLRNE